MNNNKIKISLFLYCFFVSSCFQVLKSETNIEDDNFDESETIISSIFNSEDFPVFDYEIDSEINNVDDVENEDIIDNIENNKKPNSSVISGKASTGYYITGGIGGSQISDIEYINSNQKITFDDGLGFDLGFGYDFGSARLEGTWNRGQSPGGTDRGTVFVTDTTIDSFLMTGYYDFRSSKQWSPFVGISTGSTKVDHLNVDDSGFSYGLALGLSYKTSDTTEFFLKSTGIVTPELDTLRITNGTYGNGTIGVRVHF